jgi:hypothetical protein
MHCGAEKTMVKMPRQPMALFRRNIFSPVPLPSGGRDNWNFGIQP